MAWTSPAPLVPAEAHRDLRLPARRDAGVGVTVAITLLSAWVITLACALAWPLPWWLALFTVLLRTWLSAGLFITAHDAMHGVVDPGRPRLNHFLGAVAVFVYAGFSYRPLLEAHHAHHAAPATPDDPDYHRGDARPWAWFADFMRRYLSLRQLVTIALFFQLATWGLGVEPGVLLLYWAVPAGLSAVQLWWFGTFRPHRPRSDGFADDHRSAGEDWPVWATLLACFHFGLHHTHHLAPWVPWWRLPRARRAVDELRGRGGA